MCGQSNLHRPAIANGITRPSAKSKVPTFFCRSLRGTKFESSRPIVPVSNSFVGVALKLLCNTVVIIGKVVRSTTSSDSKMEQDTYATSVGQEGLKLTQYPHYLLVAQK